MATKPVTTYTFATDANFGSGPASGFPTKIIPASLNQGFIPGDSINAEWSNYLFNISGQWITDWLALGSSVATLDAHIVETDSDGTARIAALILGDTVSTDTALLVENNTGAVGAAIQALNTAGGYAVLATSSGSSAAIRGVSNFGTGPAIEGLGLTTDAAGVFSNILSGPGIEATSSSNTGAVISGSGTGHGVDVVANGTGSGGVFDRQVGGGPSVQCLVSGVQPAIRGSLYLEPMSEPSVPVDGDLWKIVGVSGSGRGGLEWHDADGAPGGGGGGKQRAWSTKNGNGRRYTENLGDSTESTGVNATKVSLTLGANASPGDPQGVWDIFWYCEMSLPGGVPVTTRGVAEFHGPGGLIAEHNFDFTSLGDEKHFSGFIQDTLGAGPQSYSIRFRTRDDPNGVILKRARIRAIGAFE